MDKTTIVVCAAVGSLGVLSAILGFSAEGTKLTPYTILHYVDDCIYPQNPALGLGICAAIFLLVAQVTISAVGGCCGCCKSRSIPSETKRIVGIVCAVFSWIAAVIAWALLIEGAAWNANVVRHAAPYCPYLKDGIFAGAGVLSLAATALGITSYIMLRTQQAKTAALPVPAEGKPQFPGAAAQGNNGSHPPNQDSPPQAQPSSAARQEAVASAPHGEPSDDLPAPPQVPQPPQVNVPNPYDTPQCPQPQVAGLDVPVPLHPPTTTSAGNGQPGPRLSTVVRDEVTKQGIRLAAKMVEHTILSNN